MIIFLLSFLFNLLKEQIRTTFIHFLNILSRVKLGKINILSEIAKNRVMCYSWDMLTKNKKQRIIKEVKVHDTDTGSPEVQIAILSRRINDLASHLKKNKKDKHSRRGLLGLVADRKAHMKYLEKKDKKRYNALVKKLDLKKSS